MPGLKATVQGVYAALCLDRHHWYEDRPWSPVRCTMVQAEPEPVAVSANASMVLASKVSMSVYPRLIIDANRAAGPVRCRFPQSCC